MQESAKQLQPSIAEILRTCVLPLSVKLQVEHVVPTRTRREDNPTEPDVRGEETPANIRLYVSDGVLTIQAMLLGHSSSFNSPFVRDVLELTKFEVRKSRRTSGSGHVVFLAVKEYSKSESERDLDVDGEGGFIRQG